MKYIYYIIFILLFISAIVGYQVASKPSSNKNAALIINNRVITRDEFNRLDAAAHNSDKEEFINSLINKELMIQEAQRVGIDKDEPFRRSIQNFYEQSLIKLLMDRKFKDLTFQISDDELNRYVDSLNRKFHLTIFSAADEDAAKKGKYLGQETKVSQCEDLSDEIKDCLATLKEGDMTAPIRAGAGVIVIRIDKVESPGQVKTTDSAKEKIMNMLIQQKKQKAMDTWINDLRKKAIVKNQLK